MVVEKTPFGVYYYLNRRCNIPVSVTLLTCCKVSCSKNYLLYHVHESVREVGRDACVASRPSWSYSKGRSTMIGVRYVDAFGAVKIGDIE